MDKKVLNPMMLFLGFYLLMKEEKASGKRKNLLYKKLLNREFASEDFETLFKEFRNAFETKVDKFFDTYQWFEGDGSLVFAGSPEQYEKRNRYFKAIEPTKFIIKDDVLIVKVDRSGQTNVATVCGDEFVSSQSCYPFQNFYLSIKKVSKSRYYPQLIEATKVAISSLA